MSDDEDEIKYDMVMPFVVVTSVGGPYEDEAYCAGYETGRVEAILEHAKPPWWGSVVRTANVAQIDLIAMRFGYAVSEKIEHEHGWTSIKLTKTHDPLSEDPNRVRYIFATREEAQRVLEAMYAILDKFGFVTLADMCDLIGLAHKNNEGKFGWTSLVGEVKFKQIRAGWLLDLPKVIELSK